MYKPKHAAARKRKPHRILSCLLSLCIAGMLCYCIFVFGNVGPVRYWRNIYIETAMTTAHHKWLATYFIPQSIIENVMSRQSGTVDTIGGLSKQPASSAASTPSASAAIPAPLAVPSESTAVAQPQPTQAPSATPVPDTLGQQQLTVGQKNEQGDLVKTNDLEQGIVILQITAPSYVAHLAMVSDPSRVFVAATDQKGERGTLICDYLSRNDAVLGINASGFADEAGHGTGGTIAGLCYAGGTAWGDYLDSYVSFGFSDENRLLVGHIPDWDQYHIRDGAQFKPALLIDGEVVTAGSNGWGLQPRSCIGQCEDGTVLFLVVDGRQPGYSIGATVGDCAAILQRYGAANAVCCDGGSSAVMAYNGSLVSTPSTSMKTTGRWLPNAFLVAKRDADAAA